MKRCIILMMDSFGIGAASDAAAFGDSGADTLGHIVEWTESIVLPFLFICLI